jgi:tetratricopeptide (TPR) repeat protein
MRKSALIIGFACLSYCFVPNAYAVSDFDQLFIALKDGNAADALRVSGKILAREPRNYDALVGHGVATFWLGKRQEGTRELERVVQLFPEKTLAQAHLINIYSASGEWDKALAHADAVLKSDPSNHDAYWLRAQALTMKRRYRESLVVLDSAIQKWPKSLPLKPEIHAIKLADLVATGQLDTAEKYAQRLDLNKDVQWTGVVTFANDLAAQGMDARCYFLMDLCPTKNKMDGAQYLMAITAARKNKVDVAEKYAHMLWKDHPDKFPTARVEMASMYARLGMYSSAQKCLEGLKPSLRTSWHYWNAFYDVHKHLQNYEQAIADMTHGLACAHSDAERIASYQKLAETHLIIGDAAKAVADMSKAIKLNPADASLYMRRADIYDELQDHKAALADRAKASQIAK